MKVSVIIPVYNQKQKYFEECLNSVTYQTYKPEEVIIIDDGSDKIDVNAEVNKILKDKKISIKILKNKKNMGIGYCRQRGVEEATGDYITFLSSDDVWDKNFIKRMVENAFLDPYKILFCSYYIINEKSDVIDIFNPPYFNDHDDFCIACWVAAEKNTMFVNFSTVFIPKDVFKIVKFDKSLRYCEDLDFLLRSMKHFKYKLVNEPLLLYRVADNLTSKIINLIPKQNEKIRKKCLEYWKKN